MRSYENILSNLEAQSKKIKRVTNEINFVKDKILLPPPPPMFETPTPAASLSPIQPRDIKKKVIQGPRGGLYYHNDSGKRVYLSPNQCQKCERGTLEYPYEGCPVAPPRLSMCQSSRVSLKRKIRKLKASKKTLKRRLRSQKK